MKIDIDKLTEAELIDLNHRIVQRLRFLQQMRSHSRMLQFSIGDRVEFQPDGHPAVVGMLTRYNKKTVTVVTALWSTVECGASVSPPRRGERHNSYRRTKCSSVPKGMIAK